MLQGPETILHEVPSKNQNWLPKEEQRIHTVNYNLELPADLPAGTYTFKLKLYSPQEKQDVNLALDPNLQDGKGYYEIATIEIKP
jgi:hypothetical protein